MDAELLDDFRKAMKPWPDIPLAWVADCYGVTRQHFHKLRKNGVDQANLENPDALLEVLTNTGRRSPLRTKLADPANRAAIREKMSKTLDRHAQRFAP